jgi:predicted DNA binding CopG/RHH family protein
MDKTIHKYDSLEAMKADEYRQWQRLTPRERLDAAAELSLAAFRTKESHVPVRLQRTLVRLPQPEN